MTVDPGMFMNDATTFYQKAMRQEAEQRRHPIYVQGEHYYLSTSCFHGLHTYCGSDTVAGEPLGHTSGENPIGYTTIAIQDLVRRKKPAECKFCPAKCICPCHYPVIDVEPLPLGDE